MEKKKGELRITGAGQ